jgi:pyruvate dehydrogenase E2 component (dihydrolipoamide acetyltransferase)
VKVDGIDGTGPQGAVTEADVEKHLNKAQAQSEEPTETSDGSDLTVIESDEVTGTWKVIAERLSQSAREKPHAMGTREIPIGQLEAFRGQLANQYDVKLSLNDLLLSLVGRVLEDLPEFNAYFENGYKDSLARRISDTQLTESEAL